MTISRTPIRKSFAGLLQTALVGSGLPAQEVHDHLVGDFRGASPVVVVSSGPIQRLIQSFGNCDHAVIVLNVYVFVLYADGTGAWDEADAEDKADEIEAIIADIVISNQHHANWNSAAYVEEPTAPMVVEIGGLGYRRELIKVQFEVIA